MSNLPDIHLIHASDAPQHVGTLKEILQKLKAEHRIAEFTTYNPEDQLANLAEQVKDHDGVLTLLTQELEPVKEEIESRLRALKTSHSEVKIAEIIVDQVPYENEFITFPSDLRPVRGRDDMDAVWNGIEQSLKGMFPAQSVPPPPPPVDWKKYLKYAIPVIVIIALLLWWKPWEPKPDNGAGDIVAAFTANPTTCEAPCEVSFENTSENAATYAWDFGDGTTSAEANPAHSYSQPGDYTVKLIAQQGDQQHEKTSNVTITSPEENTAFKVTNVAAAVSGSDRFSGACPHKFDFTGNITVNKAGNVKYTWLRSDGATAPEQTLNFSEAGSQTVSTSWTLGGAGNTYNDMWQQIKIIEPSEMTSDRATFNLQCEDAPVATINEDCLNFNPQHVEATNVNGSWKIVDGDHWMFDFGDKADAARNGAAIIHHYGLNQSCFVGRPNPSFQYMLVSGQSPVGNAPEEDCISFNPNTIEVKQINGSWKIVDGSHWMFDFGDNQQEAEQAFAIIKKYGFTNSCYVGRPNPPMSYLRK